MTTLEEKIREYGSECIDTAELPEGHEVRFLARLRRRRTIRAAAGVAAALAVAAALLLFALPSADIAPSLPELSGDSPESVYACYLELKEAEYGRMLAEGGVAGTEWYQTFELISEENRPLMEFMPSEVEEKEKTEILIQHYSKIVNELASLEKEFKDKR